MRKRHADILLVAITLAASVLSLVFLSLSWHHAVVEGRSFPGIGRALSVQPLVDSVPFAWPYGVAGFLFRWRHPPRRALWRAAGTGLAGAALHALLVRAEFPPLAPWDSYVYFYSRLVSAPLLAVLGFALARASRSRHEPVA
jgi:hypothetical protein